MPNTHNMFAYLRTHVPIVPLDILEVSVRLMSDRRSGICLALVPGVSQYLVSDSTVCRKTFLLVDVESSSCENYFKDEKYLRNSSMLLLLLTLFRSTSWSSYQGISAEECL